MDKKIQKLERLDEIDNWKDSLAWSLRKEWRIMYCQVLSAFGIKQVTP